MMAQAGLFLAQVSFFLQVLRRESASQSLQWRRSAARNRTCAIQKPTCAIREPTCAKGNAKAPEILVKSNNYPYICALFFRRAETHKGKGSRNNV